MKKPAPRICIVRQYFFPKEAHVRRDVETLLAEGYEVDVICAREAGDRLTEQWGRVTVYRVPITHVRGNVLRYLFEYTAFFILTAWILTVRSFMRGYRIIEVDTMPDFLVFTTLIPKLFGAKVVLYLFENMPYLMSKKYRLSTTHPVIQTLSVLERLCWRYADRLIFTHRRTGKPTEKSTLVFNVPDDAVFPGPGPSPVERPERKNGTVVMMTHSTLTEVYGIQTIIKAVGLLVDRYPRLQLHIIGEGEYKDILVQLTRTLNITSAVTFEGFIPFRQVPGALRRADFGIVSVLSEYLLPNKLFEYIALGIPVACSDVQTIRDFLSDDELLFFKPGDERALATAIEKMIHDRSRAKKRAANALRSYRIRFQWSIMKQRYLDVHRSLLGQR